MMDSYKKNFVLSQKKHITISVQCQTSFCGECKNMTHMTDMYFIHFGENINCILIPILLKFSHLVLFLISFHEMKYWCLYPYVVATLPFLLFLYAELHTMLMYATARTLGCVLMTWIQMIPLGTYDNIWPPDCSIRCIECDIHLNHAIWYCAMYDKLL